MMLIPLGLQANDDAAAINPFIDAFEGMFDNEYLHFNELDSAVMDNPPPPVPVDGGLLALLGTGVAMGYWWFRRGHVREANIRGDFFNLG